MAKSLSVNERVLKSVNVDMQHQLTSYYQPFVDGWQVERMGSVPTPAMFAAAALFTKRGAGREAGWHAMALRPEGVTVAQYLATGIANGTAHNHLKALVTAGYFDRHKAAGAGNAITFTATFTEAGERALNDRLIAAGLRKAPKASKPVKVKAKANKAKAKPEATPAVDPEGALLEQVEHAQAAPEAASPEALAALAAQFNS